MSQNAGTLQSRPVEETNRANTEWERVRKGMASVIGPFDERSAALSSEYLDLSEAERQTLRRIAHVPPASRSYAEVRTLLNLLRGADLLIKLSDGDASAVAGSMRLAEYGKGDLICSEHNAQDGFLLVVEGTCTVLVRDLTVHPPRAPLFHLRAGESFSEESLLDSSRRAPSLVAGAEGGGGAAREQGRLPRLRRRLVARAPRAQDHRALLGAVLPVRGAAAAPVAGLVQETVHANTVVIKQGTEAVRCTWWGAARRASSSRSTGRTTFFRSPRSDPARSSAR